jgi:AcrR family transcriptional regulator
MCRMEDSSNPKIKRSDRALAEAFMALWTERGPGAFSVTDVARRAGVNRATFYRHFEGLEDLGDRGVAIALAEIVGSLPSLPAEFGMDWTALAESRVRRFFELVLEHAEFLRPIFEGRAGGSVQTKARVFLEGFVLSERIEKPATAWSLPPSLMTAALSALAQGFAIWLIENPQADPAELSRMYVKALSSGFVDRSKLPGIEGKESCTA